MDIGSNLCKNARAQVTCWAYFLAPIPCIHSNLPMVSINSLHGPNPRIFLHNIGSNEISLPHTKGLQPYFSLLYESILFFFLFLRKFQPLASTLDDRKISQLVFNVDEIEYQISYSIIKAFTSLAN